MRKHIAVFIISLVCVACSTEKSAEISAVSASLTAFKQVETSSTETQTPVVYTKTPKPTQTATRKPTKIVTNTPTFTPIPSNTPTFDSAQMITVTPAQPNACPQQNVDVVTPNFEAISTEQGPYAFAFSENYLAYLNLGGTVQALAIEWQPDDQVDLTNDNIPELIFRNLNPLFIGFSVFACENGKYQDLPFSETRMDGNDNLEIIAIRDANLNGIPEIVILVDKWTQGIEAYGIFEWNGEEMRNLVADDMHSNFGEISWWASLDHLEIQDIDGNGTLEFIWHWQEPGWTTYVEGLPWRRETHTYMWNGEEFVFYSKEYSPAIYRFQAVQDGDEASLASEFDRALDLYQQSIFNNDLEWWSLERREYEQSHSMDVRPTPIPSLLLDPNEYPNLAAYAYYRIMIMDVMQGEIEDALEVFDIMLEEFPDDKPGSSYTEMARLFIKEYIDSESIEQACNQAIRYAAEHSEEILYYIGNSEVNEWNQFGEQSNYYLPEDICPFQ